MPTATIVISEAAHKALCEMAAQTGQPAQAVLERAIDEYRRKLFFAGLKADYAALKADPEAWAEELAERKLWEATLMDGLDPDERWANDGSVIAPDQEAP